MALKPLSYYKGVGRRLFLLYKHGIGLWIGARVASVKARPAYRRKGIRFAGAWLLASFLKIFLKKELRKQPFEVQLRRRLEMLGPTYIKLGQIMAIREDILPSHVTAELKKLLDQLPAAPFAMIRKTIEESLDAPLRELFIEFREQPLASASIGQTHRATTHRGKPVAVKVIKPGIRETVLSDLKLLRMLSTLLEWVIPRYQPKLIISEFCNYTEKELDLECEADHAEIFAANFAKQPNIVFPKIYRELSSRDVLCMEYFNGIKPNQPSIFELSKANQHKVINLGAGAIIKMLYEDGFFHADLHAANLIVLPGPKLGFIDLGMVGRFDEKMKRNMLHYFYALVNGDVERTAKHLLSMATVGKKGDPEGFKRAAADLFRRYLLHAANGDFSLARVILQSLAMGGKYHVFFPVEMTLMVKALVTFEGVGKTLDPVLNVPKLSRRHILRIYKSHFSVDNLFSQLMQGMPELVDVAVHLPELIADSSRFWDRTVNTPPGDNPLAGLRSGLIAGSCIVGGVIALVQGANPLLWIGLFAAGIGLALFGKG